MKIQSDKIFTSPILKNGLKKISENSALFGAGACLVFSAIARPLSILATPDTEKEDKKISAIKSIISALNGFLFMMMVSSPFSKGIKKIDSNPEKYLKPETIKNLSKGANDIKNSDAYRFLTQFFKLGLTCLLAYPKALVNNTILPLVMKKNEETPSFKGGCEKIVSNVINNEKMQKFAKKFQNTKYTTHLIALGDIFSTLASIHLTHKNKKLNDHEKKILNYNSIISTILCLTIGYGADNALDKPFGKFISKLKSLNKNSSDLSKYIEGAKILKTTMVFGIVYYCLIPLVSTFLSGKLAKKKDHDL